MSNPIGSLAERYDEVRSATDALAAPLSPEDCAAQSMPDASPVKWHLAHTSWFFETFVLEREEPGHAPFDPDFRVLFNSYYQSVGPQHARPERGLLTRPDLDSVRAYRRHVDERVAARLAAGDLSPEALEIVEIGLHHEQQHQELILTDVLHLFSRNPMQPAYRADGPRPEAKPTALRWFGHPGGLVEIGHAGPGFAFDNEGPRHRVHLVPFELASRLVTNGEYLAFMEDGGYRRPELWLSDAWARIQTEGWQAPLYFEREGEGGRWSQLGLAGPREVDPDAPVCHVSHYEADAYARWAGARLPSEAEWEVMAADAPREGNFAEGGLLAPAGAPEPEGGPVQLFGDCWEWTASPYGAYPGYAPPPGALGEYNGKFMANQMVLRGGSCATPASHVRATYRNFFFPDARWQWSGIRLARDAR